MYFLAGSFWEKIIQWDHSFFITINSQWTNPVFDRLMPFMRNSWHWIPVYMFLLVFMLLNFRIKGLWWAVFFLATVAATDMIGMYVFKEGIERYRPCRNSELEGQVRLLVSECGSGWSFISNHAANHFGMATFFFLTFRRISKPAAWIAIFWAFLIAYSQVYVGLHFPLDVLCGAMLGVAFGAITGTFFNKRFGIAIFDNQPVV
jgi:undecaprenyl-diphosphatase